MKKNVKKIFLGSVLFIFIFTSNQATKCLAEETVPNSDTTVEYTTTTEDDTSTEDETTVEDEYQKKLDELKQQGEDWNQKILNGEIDISDLEALLNAEINNSNTDSSTNSSSSTTTTTTNTTTNEITSLTTEVLSSKVTNIIVNNKEITFAKQLSDNTKSVTTNQDIIFDLSSLFSNASVSNVSTTTSKTNDKIKVSYLFVPSSSTFNENTKDWSDVDNNKIILTNECVGTVYVKLTSEVDSSINAIVKSNQITIDKTAAKVTGVSTGKVYKSSKVIKFSDKVSGVAKATLNGKTIKSGYKVKKAGTYSLKVTDNAGNINTVKFTIKK